MPHTHEVLRAIHGPEGRIIPAGTLVDASGWKTTRALEGDEPFSARSGRLRRLKPGAAKAAKAAKGAKGAKAGQGAKKAAKGAKAGAP